MSLEDLGRQVLLHYDGIQWQVAYVPQAPLQDTPSESPIVTVDDIAMISPDEGWAVGKYTRGISQGSEIETVLLHYQYGVWSLYQR